MLNSGQIRTQSDDLRPFMLPHSWEVALSSLLFPSAGSLGHDRQIFLVKGAKKSGKSTFSRTLLNRLLTLYATLPVRVCAHHLKFGSRYRKVAFLECDVGQSEFTPGGMVSLNVVSKYTFGMLVDLNPSHTNAHLHQDHRGHILVSRTWRTTWGQTHPRILRLTIWRPSVH